MSKYLDTISYFTSLAQSNLMLRHNGFDDGVQRKAFISISDEEELIADIINNLADKFAVQVGFTNTSGSNDGAVNNTYTHSLRFYVKATIVYGEQSVKENSYDQAFAIAQQWQQKIMYDATVNDGCGALGFVDLGSFTCTKLPPLYDNHFGFQLTFTEQAPDASYLLPDYQNWD
ncbi:hypothetical protein ACFOW1_01605 [Parasediminibacterium paludis]|uniref:Uncharacterized protein n=1 Tax=Parasediminibacterium paludis TaxID=908966 RepID=A0ABV8PR64_9BACT